MFPYSRYDYIVLTNNGYYVSMKSSWHVDIPGTVGGVVRQVEGVASQVARLTGASRS